MSRKNETFNFLLRSKIFIVRNSLPDNMEKAELEGRTYKGYNYFNLLPKVKEIYSNKYVRERHFRLIVKTPGASSLYLLRLISLEIGKKQ